MLPSAAQKKLHAVVLHGDWQHNEERLLSAALVHVHGSVNVHVLVSLVFKLYALLGGVPALLSHAQVLRALRINQTPMLVQGAMRLLTVDRANMVHFTLHDDWDHGHLAVQSAVLHGINSLESYLFLFPP